MVYIGEVSWWFTPSRYESPGSTPLTRAYGEGEIGNGDICEWLHFLFLVQIAQVLLNRRAMAVLSRSGEVRTGG